MGLQQVVLIYIPMCVSVYWSLCAVSVCAREGLVCVCVTVCDNKSEYQQNTFYLGETFNERNIFMRKPHNKALLVINFKAQQIYVHNYEEDIID